LVLATEPAGLRVRDVHARVGLLLGAPVSWGSVKSSLDRLAKGSNPRFERIGALVTSSSAAGFSAKDRCQLIAVLCRLAQSAARNGSALPLFAVLCRRSLTTGRKIAWTRRGGTSALRPNVDGQRLAVADPREGKPNSGVRDFRPR
jgi:hypothetical protein